MLYNLSMPVSLDPVSKFFWDIDISALSWERDQDFIIRRLLQSGDSQSLHWLRSQINDHDLKEWIIRHNGRGLSPRQIRYWALMLEIEPALADGWVKSVADLPWEKR